MKYFALLSGLIISFCGYGQHIGKEQQSHDSSYNQSNYKQITLTLAPIAIDNGKYYFNGQRAKYEELVLPLMSLNDQMINRRVKTVRTMRELFRPIFIVETLYLLQLQLSGIYTQSQIREMTYTYIGLLVFNEIYRLSIQIVKRKAINRYNDLVLRPTASFSPVGGLSVGCNIRF